MLLPDRIPGANRGNASGARRNRGDALATAGLRIEPYRRLARCIGVKSVHYSGGSVRWPLVSAPVLVPVVTTKAGARARELTQRTVQSVADVLVSSDREPEVTSSVHRHPVEFTDVLGSANTTLGKLAPSRGVGLPPLVSVIAVPPGERRIPLPNG